MMTVSWLSEEALTLRLFSKLIRAPCGGHKEHAVRTPDITYQRPLRQTALGGPLQKWARQNSSRTHGNLRPSFWQRLHRPPLRSAEVCKLTDTCSHTNSAGVVKLLLPPPGRAGPYPAWWGRSETSPSTVSSLASLPVEKYRVVISLKPHSD